MAGWGRGWDELVPFRWLGGREVSGLYTEKDVLRVNVCMQVKDTAGGKRCRCHCQKHKCSQYLVAAALSKSR